MSWWSSRRSSLARDAVTRGEELAEQWRSSGERWQGENVVRSVDEGRV